jgi:myo-inositol-1-phosphate synthase
MGAHQPSSIYWLLAAIGCAHGGRGKEPNNLELRLGVWDALNSAGVVIDAIRSCKLALDRGIGVPLGGPSNYLVKSPPQKCSDDEARRQLEAFIEGSEDGSEA